MFHGSSENVAKSAGSKNLKIERLVESFNLIDIYFTATVPMSQLLHQREIWTWFHLTILCNDTDWHYILKLTSSVCFRKHKVTHCLFLIYFSFHIFHISFNISLFLCVLLSLLPFSSGQQWPSISPTTCWNWWLALSSVSWRRSTRM